MRLDTDNLYNILGINADSSRKEIRKAYKRLAHQHHPDNGGEAERFKKISEAYQILHDPEQRSVYDQQRKDAQQEAHQRNTVESDQGSQSWDNGRWPGTHPGSTGDSDWFTIMDLFGGGGVDEGNQGWRGAVQYPTDTHSELTLDLRTALAGTTVGITNPDGSVTDARIPGGYGENHTYKITGKGQTDPVSGVRGDLYVHVHVEEPTPWRRRGRYGLELDMPVDMLEALQGATIEVPGWDTDHKIRIPGGLADQSTVRITGGGLTIGNHTGDLYLKILVLLPDDLDAAALTTIAEIRSNTGRAAREKLR